MKRVFRVSAGMLMVLLLASQAAAAERNTFVIAPFSVQGPDSYSYLQQSIPQMLTSRIFWKDRVEPAGTLPANAKPPASEADAEKLRAQLKADYVIWGSATIVGDTCSLDVRVRDKSGKVWPQAREARASQLIGAITGVSDGINRDVFGRAPQPVTTGGGGTRVNRMNPDIQVNETSNREVYLNPQFRYSGASAEDDSRLRSQPLSFPSIGMEVVDGDGDGKNEIFILEDTKVHAYRFDQGKLTPLAEFVFPINHQCLNIRSISHPSGRPWIIVTSVDVKGQPLSYIFNFTGTEFTVVMKNIRWYLNVVKNPPTYRNIIIGQQAMPPRLFKPGVHEMIRQGDTLAPAGRLNLPADANVFNFTYMPPSRGDQNSEKLFVLSQRENIRIYNNKNSRMGETTEQFSGSATGLEIDPSMPGFHRDDVTLANMFYVPMRMIPADLEQDGTWELIVNKPISTASEIFDRYRFFPQSEIHSLFWDGLGLNLQWKTRRIKGSMVDYALADANNDGILDLVTCLNTHPGALGVKSRKTTVVIYPLDLGLTAPGTATDKSDIYDN